MTAARTGTARTPRGGDRSIRNTRSGKPADRIFAGTRAARAAEDGRLETFAAGLTEAFLGGTIRYVNNQGLAFEDPMDLLVTHLFNHQTHHRGQAHTLLGQAGAETPDLDMIYFLREA